MAAIVHRMPRGVRWSALAWLAVAAYLAAGQVAGAADDPVRVVPKLAHKLAAVQTAFASNGELFASLGMTELVVWRTADRSIVASFDFAPGAEVVAIAFVPGTEHLACLEERGGLVVREARTGTVLKRVACGPGTKNGLHFSPRGGLAAVVSARAVEVMDLASGNRVCQAPSQGTTVGLTWQADERALWQCTDQVLAARVNLPLGIREVLLAERNAKSACVLAGGRFVARTMGDKTVQVWDVGEKKLRWEATTPKTSARGDFAVAVIAVSNDETFYISSSGALLRATAQEAGFTKVADSGRYYWHLALDHTGKYLLGSGFLKVGFIDLAAKTATELGPSPVQLPPGVGALAAVAAGDRGLCLRLWDVRGAGVDWDLSSLRPVASPPGPPVLRMLSGGEQYECVPRPAADGGPVGLGMLLRRARDGKEIGSVPAPSRELGKMLMPKVLAPDLTKAYLTGFGAAAILDVASGRQVALATAPLSLHAAFGRDGQFLYLSEGGGISGRKSGVAVFAVATGEKVKEFAMDAVLGERTRVSLANGQDRYAVAGTNTMQVRSLPDNALRCQVGCAAPYEFSDFPGPLLLPDGQRVLLSESSGQGLGTWRLSLIAAAAGERLWSTDLGGELPGEIAFSPAGAAAFVVFAGGVIGVFDLATGQRRVNLLSFEDGRHLAWTEDGHYCAFGDPASLVQLQTATSIVPLADHPELNSADTVRKALAFVK